MIARIFAGTLVCIGFYGITESVQAHIDDEANQKVVQALTTLEKFVNQYERDTAHYSEGIKLQQNITKLQQDLLALGSGPLAFSEISVIADYYRRLGLVLYKANSLTFGPLEHQRIISSQFYIESLAWQTNRLANITCAGVMSLLNR